MSPLGWFTVTLHCAGPAVSVAIPPGHEAAEVGPPFTLVIVNVKAVPVH
jgi:hypothetical protein